MRQPLQYVSNESLPANSALIVDCLREEPTGTRESKLPISRRHPVSLLVVDVDCRM